MANNLPRNMIEAWCNAAPSGIRERLVRSVEILFGDVESAAGDASGAVKATGSIQSATVLTLSSNAAFENERVLTAGAGVSLADGGPGSTLTIAMSSPVTTVGGFALTFNLPADCNLNLRSNGTIPSSDDGPYADDTAAAAAGIQVGEWYAKTGGTVVWRQV